MATSKIWLVLSAVMGAGAALLTTTLQDAGKVEQQAAVARADEASKHAPTSKAVIAEVSPGRLDRLEQEMAHLRNERNEPPSATPEVLPSPQEDQRRLEARFAGLERQLMAEPVDASWSRAATESLRNDLSAAAKDAGFKLVAAECRTEMCRATLQWANYEAALKTGMRLPERLIPGLNCVRSVWLKEPDDPAGPYSSNLFLDCSEQRAGNVDTIAETTMTRGRIQ